MKLEQDFDPHDAFASADSFYRAAATLSEHVTGDNRVFTSPQVSVIITNLALSAEVFLKCLLQLQLGVPKGGHKLKCLLQDLPADDQAQIRSTYAVMAEGSPVYASVREELPNVRVNFDSVLESLGSPFVSWRYAYESKFSLPSIGLLYIAYAIRARIVELRPGWGREYPIAHPDQTPFVITVG